MATFVGQMSGKDSLDSVETKRQDDFDDRVDKVSDPPSLEC